MFKRKGHIRGLKELDDPDIKFLLSTRVGDSTVLSIGKVMETIIWGYVEKRVLSVWFPGVAQENLQHMAILDKEIRVGGEILTRHVSLNTLSSAPVQSVVSVPCVIPISDVIIHLRLLRKGRILARIYRVSPLSKP